MAVAASSFKDQYPALSAIRLQATILISSSSSENIQEIDRITNEIVLELHHFKDKHQCTCKDLHGWLSK